MLLPLRNNQIIAINKFEEHYYKNKNNKGILSMCCGSGKTRTSYEIIKKCISKQERFFIYTTSRLILIESIIKEFIKWLYIENKLYINIFVNASDISLSEIHKECINELKPVKIFYDRLKKKVIKIKNENHINDLLKINKNEIIIIISTYESIEKVFNVIDQFNHIQPNLFIADEAHNLVSNNNELKKAKIIFRAHDDENYNCDPNKYLFLTATPLQIIKRNNDAGYIDDSITYSMNNADIYGKIFYEYTFKQGIKDNIISNFEIIYLTDYHSDDTEIIDIISELKNKTKDIQNKFYFESISKILLKIIQLYDLKHIIVFISDQDKAKIFKELLEKYKSDNINVYKIVSDDSIENKRANKKEFEIYNGNPKILISVQMLDEGVDIPICDSVFFAEERNSESVIVQNIGRALRKNNYKTISYVIIPTKIYNSEDNSNMFSSKFSKIREIADILKNPKSNNFYSRKTIGYNDKNENENKDENDENDENDEEYYDINNILNNIDEKTNKLINTFDILSTNFNIGNMKLNDIKILLQKYKINKINKIIPFIENHNLLVTSTLHDIYKLDWISYSDLLFNNVFTYNEAIDFIKNNIDLSKINTSHDWNEYYYKNIINGLYDKEFIDDIIFIPSSPDTYYLDEWEVLDINNLTGWSKFLNKYICEEKTHKSGSKTLDDINNNLSNIVNNDKNKINNGYEWLNFNNATTNLYPLKLYIDNLFSIDSNYYIKYKLKDNKYDDSFFIKFNNIKVTANYKISYKSTQYKLNIKTSSDKSEKYFYIYDRHLKKIIDDLKEEFKNYVKLK